MDPGKWRHRVTIESCNETQDETGQAIKTWTPLMYLWACIEPLNGRELFEARQTVADVSHKATIPYTQGISSENRIAFGSRTLNIDAVINTDEINAELVMYCTERT